MKINDKLSVKIITVREEPPDWVPLLDTVLRIPMLTIIVSTVMWLGIALVVAYFKGML